MDLHQTAARNGPKLVLSLLLSAILLNSALVAGNQAYGLTSTVTKIVEDTTEKANSAAGGNDDKEKEKENEDQSNANSGGNGNDDDDNDSSDKGNTSDDNSEDNDNSNNSSHGNDDSDDDKSNNSSGNKDDNSGESAPSNEQDESEQEEDEQADDQNNDVNEPEEQENNSNAESNDNEEHDETEEANENDDNNNEQENDTENDQAQNQNEDQSASSEEQESEDVENEDTQNEQNDDAVGDETSDEPESQNSSESEETPSSEESELADEPNNDDMQDEHESNESNDVSNPDKEHLDDNNVPEQNGSEQENDESDQQQEQEMDEDQADGTVPEESDSVSSNKEAEQESGITEERSEVNEENSSSDIDQKSDEPVVDDLDANENDSINDNIENGESEHSENELPEVNEELHDNLDSDISENNDEIILESESLEIQNDIDAPFDESSELTTDIISESESNPFSEQDAETDPEPVGEFPTDYGTIGDSVTDVALSDEIVLTDSIVIIIDQPEKETGPANGSDMQDESSVLTTDAILEAEINVTNEELAETVEPEVPPLSPASDELTTDADENSIEQVIQDETEQAAEVFPEVVEEESVNEQEDTDLPIFILESESYEAEEITVSESVDQEETVNELLEDVIEVIQEEPPIQNSEAIELPVEELPPANVKPIAILDGPFSTSEGSEVEFSAEKSFDVDGTIEQYFWDFGDAKTALTDEPVVWHTYPDDGIYVVAMTVIDDKNLSSESCIFVINVENIAPTISVNETYDSVHAGDKISFGVEISEPGNDNVTLVVDFGDGDIEETEITTGDNQVHVSHTFEETGAYTIIASAQDDDGGSGDTDLLIPVTSGEDLKAVKLAAKAKVKKDVSTITSKIALKNTGEAKITDDVKLEVYLSTDEILDASDVELGGKTIASSIKINKTAKTSLKLTVSEALERGTYYLIVVLDPDNQIPELDEDNNIMTDKFRVR